MFTGTALAGAWIPFASASFTVCSGFTLAVDPSGNVTVASPLAATSTSTPGFAAFTAAFTAAFSSSVNSDGLFTGTALAGAWIPFASAVLIVLLDSSVAIDPPIKVIIAVPLLFTVIFVAAGFTFLIASFTLFFSNSVNLFIFITGVIAGFITLIVNTAAALSMSVLPSLYVTTTLFPFNATLSILSLNVGFAFFIIFVSSVAFGTSLTTLGVDGIWASYLNVCGFHIKRMRPTAPASVLAPTFA